MARLNQDDISATPAGSGRWPRLTWWVLLLSGWAGLAAGVDNLPPAETDPNQPTPSKIPDPHGRAEKLASCHPMQGGVPTPIPPGEIDRLCVKCHNGRDARSEAHPIGQVVPPKGIVLPKEWPLIQERISCITCHDVMQGCDPERATTVRNALFLRAWWSDEDETFCRNCHEPNNYPRFNPHLMRADDRAILQLTTDGRVDEPVCLFCHAQPVDANALGRTGQAKLRVEEQVLCRVCHPTHQTYSEAGHIGAKIPSEMLATMYARELLGPKVRVDPVLLARLISAGAKPTRMVPDAEGQITCTTCHNPHEEDVFPEASVLSWQSMWQVAPGRTVSPTADQQFCVYCHNR